MSFRLMLAAAYLPADVVTQGQKLVLMKICDSVDDETHAVHTARPGLARLATWAGVTDKRAVTIVTELVAKGLVERVQTGRGGRAAVYRVFPHGVPPVPDADELEGRREVERAAPKNPRKARTGVKRAAPAKPAMTYQDIDARTAARTAAHPGRMPEPEASAGFHEGAVDAGWNPDEAHPGASPVEPPGSHAGNPGGSTGEAPFFPVPSYFLPYPPPPGDCPAADAYAEGGGQAPVSCPERPVPDTESDSGPSSGCPQGSVPDAEAGERSPVSGPDRSVPGAEAGGRLSSSGCPKHAEPVGNCRGCGTNPRAGREEARRQAVVQEHAARQERQREFFAEQQRRVAQTDPQALQASVQLVRDLARQGRQAQREGRMERVDPQARQRIDGYVEELVRAGRGEPPQDPQVLEQARQYVGGRIREMHSDGANVPGEWASSATAQH